MALNKKNRLTKRRDFNEIFKAGKAVFGSFLFIKFLKTDSKDVKFAFSVSSKISKKATERNKIRRTLSEMIRKDIKSIIGASIVVVVNPKILDQNAESLKKDLVDTIKKAGLYEKNNN